MGDVALRSVTKKSGIRNNRGNQLSAIPELETDAHVYCTYSLEYLSENSNLERTVVADIGRCKQAKLDTGVPWKIWEGEEIDGDILAYDIETVDKEGNFTDFATSIAISNKEMCYVSLDIQGICEKSPGLVQAVGHNSFHFDGPILRKQGIRVRDFHDTMYMAFFMDETQPRGLEALAVKYLGVPGWKEAFHAKLGSDEFYFYNARDAWYTMQLFKLFKRELSRDKRFFLLETLIYPVRNIFDSMSLHGVFLSKDSILETKKEVVAQLESHSFEINPNSTKQVAAKLDELGMWYPLTEKGQPHVSKDILEAYRHNTPFVAELLEYREQAKQLSTYIKPYEKLANEGDGRAHPQYKMVSVETGRTSATKPNVQNLDRKLKKFFTAPPGKVLLSVDYSAIEFRVAAWLVQERGILDRFDKDPKWDPHRYFASVFYEIEESKVTKEQRQIAKSGNFSQLYCGNGFTLWEYAKKQGVELNLSLCERVHEKWHNTFPGFERYYVERKREILQTGKIACPTGFIRHFGDPELIRQNYGQKFFGKLRQAVNVPVQNLAAHIAFLAMKRLVEFCFPMVLFIHDSIGFEIDDDYALASKVKHIEKVMCEWPVKALKEEYNVNLTVPLMVESEIKRNECDR
jgi:DNA polymerase-1